MICGYVYILANDRLNVVYTGSTADLKQRVYQHKKKFIGGFTKKYNGHRLVYFEKLPSIEDATRREREIKGYRRSKKNALISEMNHEWCDLYDSLKESLQTLA
jgi:putative endonuclease